MMMMMILLLSLSTQCPIIAVDSENFQEVAEKSVDCKSFRRFSDSTRQNCNSTSTARLPNGVVTAEPY